MLDKFAKKESPILGYAGFGGGVSSLLTLASGKITYVEDVFSTYLYRGNSTARSINNGIDLAGEGGLVWTKCRTDSRRNCFLDTERGIHNVLFSDATSGTDTDNTTITSFNSNGYTMGASAYKLNVNNESMCSWTFRKCRGFFDIVTYTGNGVAGRQIAHSLGSTPGMVIVKRTSAAEDWTCYHRSLWTSQVIDLNQTSAAHNSGDVFDTTAPTSTVFTVGSSNRVNGNGSTYVAYIFAHNDGSFGEDSDEAVIKCGSYTGSGSIGKTVDLGFEPQWMLVKSADQTRPWVVIDNMRGMPRDGNGVRLLANDTAGEVSDASFLAPTPTGFEVTQQNTYVNVSGEKYIYIAIRRPHKPPEAGTDVFTPIAADAPETSNNRPEKVDMCMFMKRGGYTGGWEIADRIRGFQATNANSDDSYTTPTSVSSTNAVETTSNNAIVQQQNFTSGGPYVRPISAGSNFINYFFKRSPGFFDIVAYNGSNSAQNITHNLGVKPALIICKRRNSTGNWQVYADVPAGGATKYMMLDDTGYFNANSNRWNNTEPTATQFTVGTYSDLNTSGGTYFAYLFANLDGICKIGQYTGTGNDITIDCGFNPRFIMIKVCTNSGDGWYVFDSARGINAGGDPWLRFNQTNTAENSDTDIVDLTSGGFIVQAGAGSRANDSDGRKYLYWAIA